VQVAFLHFVVTARLNQAGDAFHGSGTITFRDPTTGAVLSSFNVTLDATRIHV
jgi:hypothetical protein